MKEPLSLPRGSVRAILTVMIVGICGLMLFVPVAEGSGDIKAMFVMLGGIVVRDYFQTRQEQNREDGPPVSDAYIHGE